MLNLLPYWEGIPVDEAVDEPQEKTDFRDEPEPVADTGPTDFEILKQMESASSPEIVETGLEIEFGPRGVQVPVGILPVLIAGYGCAEVIG